MSLFASVNGIRIVSGQLMIPLVGMWTADVQLATDQPVTGRATVVVGNLTLIGTVYRSQAYGGQTRARIVAGVGGWRTIIPAQGYGSAGGVLLSHVLLDAAAACGETITIPSDTTIGNGYARANSIASDVLWQMLQQDFIESWYIDPDGMTWARAWLPGSIATPFLPSDQRPDEGVIEIATEDYASWMPGTSFAHPLLEGTYTNAGVHYVWTPDGQFRFEVLTGTSDRFLGALQATIQRQIAPTRFYGRYEYTISNPTAITIDGTPVDPSIGLPDLQNVPIRSDSISSYTPPDGGGCHIMFSNGVPTKPICVWTDETPSHVSLLEGTTPATKLGDSVQSYVTGGLTILAGALTVTGTAPGALTVTGGLLTVQGTGPITGTVTTGSSLLSVPGV